MTDTDVAAPPAGSRHRTGGHRPSGQRQPAGPLPGTVDPAPGGDLFSAVIDGPAAVPARFMLTALDASAPREAGLAAGCLVQPEAGDLVLCGSCRTAGGMRTYILSVLERAAPDRPARLVAAGGLSLAAEGGPLSLSTDSTLSLAGGEAVQVTAARVDMDADAGSFRLRSALLESDAAMARIGTLQLLGERLLSLVKTISGRHLRVTRQVEELEQVRAGEIAVNADRTISHQAHQIVHVSKEDMRFDGARIHMG